MLISFELFLMSNNCFLRICIDAIIHIFTSSAYGGLCYPSSSFYEECSSHGLLRSSMNPCRSFSFSSHSCIISNFVLFELHTWTCSLLMVVLWIRAIKICVFFCHLGAKTLYRIDMSILSAIPRSLRINNE